MSQSIAIIMPSYLGEYEGCASDREAKFERAVSSVLSLNYGNGMLIIVSDGCSITHNKVINSKIFRNNRNVHYINIAKQPLFSGSVRQAGINIAIKKGAEIITYLDADDVIMPDHLSFIDRNLTKGLDWIYYNDLLYPDKEKGELIVRECDLKFGFIGTSNISHRARKDFSWYGLDGWGHDWAFILKLMGKSPNFIKTREHGLYVVHHIKGQFDT